MSTPKLVAKLTLTEVFENAFGKTNGDAILAEIQGAYAGGLTGRPLVEKVGVIVAKYNGVAGDTRSFGDAVAGGVAGAATTAAVG